jgi:hypothetical protein
VTDGDDHACGGSAGPVVASFGAAQAMPGASAQCQPVDQPPRGQPQQYREQQHERDPQCQPDRAGQVHVREVGCMGAMR